LATVDAHQETALAPSARGAGREQAICTSVLELLNETSYESITMDAVAARAKASKATIYRRWSNKDELIVDSLTRELARNVQDVPDTGSLRGDLIAHAAQQIGDNECRLVNTAALRGLAYAGSHDAELARLIQASIDAVFLGAWQIIIDRAVVSGELPRPVDARLPKDIAQSMFCSRTSVDLDEKFALHVIDDVIIPVIRYHAGSRE